MDNNKINLLLFLSELILRLWFCIVSLNLSRNKISLRNEMWLAISFQCLKMSSPEKTEELTPDGYESLFDGRETERVANLIIGAPGPDTLKREPPYVTSL